MKEGYRPAAAKKESGGDHKTPRACRVLVDYYRVPRLGRGRQYRVRNGRGVYGTRPKGLHRSPEARVSDEWPGWICVSGDGLGVCLCLFEVHVLVI